MSDVEFGAWCAWFVVTEIGLLVYFLWRTSNQERSN